jgi:transposase
MSTPATYVGIDVAKAELVAATPTGDLCRVPNDATGLRALLARLQTMSVAAVVMESTGCYGRAAAAALTAAGYQVAVVQPGRVHSFAASIGVRAKTDPIDARVIARFAAATQPRTTTPPPADTAALRVLVDRRDQIIEMRKQEENRLEAIGDATIAKELRTSIKRLIAAERTYTQRIAAHLATHQRLQRVSECLQGETGVGPQTVAVLLAYFPELGTINRQQAAALAGLAPYDRASGMRDGKRAIAGGRKRLRRALYLAAVSAARWSPWLKDVYTALRAKGKCAKVAIIACARKLLVRLNSLVAAVLKPVAQHEGAQPTA